MLRMGLISSLLLTLRVETSLIQASWMTATKACSARRADNPAVARPAWRQDSMSRLSLQDGASFERDGAVEDPADVAQADAPAGEDRGLLKGGKRCVACGLREAQSPGLAIGDVVEVLRCRISDLEQLAATPDRIGDGAGGVRRQDP